MSEATFSGVGRPDRWPEVADWRRWGWRAVRCRGERERKWEAEMGRFFFLFYSNPNNNIIMHNNNYLNNLYGQFTGITTIVSNMLHNTNLIKYKTCSEKKKSNTVCVFLICQNIGCI